MSCSYVLVYLPCAILVAASIVGVHPSISMTPNQIQAKLNGQRLMSNLHRQIKAKEEELKNAEAINKNFERMIQLVNIMGQVDTFLHDRTKVLVKKLALLVEDEKEIKRHFVMDDSDENSI